MHIVVLHGGGAPAFADRLVPVLEEVGPVARLERTGGTVAGEPTTRIRLDADGRWSARGAERSLRDCLDGLAPRHDFLILLTSADTEWPHLTVTDGTVRGELVPEPTAREAVDLAAVGDTLQTTEPYVTLESLVAEIKAESTSPRAGAIATFTGRVRAKDAPDDAPTEYLEFETYAGVAEEEMATIEAELADRDGVFAVRMHHRTGVIAAEEDIVFVVVLAGHREEAFRTVEDGINRLKAEVPIFKKEVTEADEFWVHTRP